jgi:hypothetical protein
MKKTHKALLKGYHLVAYQEERGATVAVWYNPDESTFYLLLDGVTILGPISESQLKTTAHTLTDVEGMEGRYGAIPVPTEVEADEDEPQA